MNLLPLTLACWTCERGLEPATLFNPSTLGKFRVQVIRDR